MLVAISDGHGLETAGKRTPAFSDGTQVLENEFNHATKLKLFEVLKRCGIKYIDVAPGQKDIPLSTRIKTANDAKATIYVSIHYNAWKGIWDTTKGGIEVLYCTGSVKGKRLAEIVLKHLVKGTQMPNRGIVARNNLAELTRTHAPAIIAECGFMDVHSQAILMKNEQYQWECAEELGMAICEYLDVKYVEPKDTTFDKLELLLAQLTTVLFDVKKEFEVLKKR